MAPPARPNIVLITSDDHRWDALGAAGNEAIHTPHLDRLAREGVHFEQATVNVSQCLPLRATLLTGLAAHTHGAYGHLRQRPETESPSAFADQPTVPGLLRDAGYATVLVGKWHLASDPWRVGFTDTRTWLAGGAEAYRDPHLSRGESRATEEARGFTQEIFADSAIEFLSGEAAERRPFLLWLAFTAPHAPFGPNPTRIQELYQGKEVAELVPAGFPRGIPTNDWRRYYEAVSHLDEQLGRVVAALERAGLAGSTMIVFLGDNGFMMGERGVGVSGAAGKVVPYESSIRVPLIVKLPGLQGFAGRSDRLLSALDLPPTMLAAAGVAAPPAWPGRNALPALRERAAPGFEDAFSEWVDAESTRFGHQAHRLVRTRRHKLIVWQDPDKPNELYELASDPREAANRSGEPGFEAVEQDLMSRLRRWLEKTSDPALGWPKLRTPGTEAAPGEASP
jgi:arylsulfatase A-like enzyme